MSTCTIQVIQIEVPELDLFTSKENQLGCIQQAQERLLTMYCKFVIHEINYTYSNNSSTTTSRVSSICINKEINIYRYLQACIINSFDFVSLNAI